MPISQRPVRRPATTPEVALVDPVDSNAQRPDEPGRSTKKTGTAPSASDHAAEREGSAASRRPLLRREPWIAVLLASVILMTLAFLVPQEAKRIIAFLSLAVAAIGVVLFAIHKPDPAEEGRMREYRREGT